MSKIRVGLKGPWAQGLGGIGDATELKIAQSCRGVGAGGEKSAALG